MPKTSSRLGKIEEEFATIVASGDYRMDADDLKAMHCDVYLLTKEMFDQLLRQWKEDGEPEFEIPLFPREEVE